MARLLVDVIQNGDTASAKDLIKTGNYGSIDAQTWRRDGTALFFCCSRGYLELAAALIEKGASVNSTDKSLATPLHGAVDNGHLKIVKLLLENGANVNSQTSRGDTPLHLSAYRGHREITQCLVEAGADHELLNVSNLTAQGEAFSQGHTDVSNYLTAMENSTFFERNPSLYTMIQLDPPNDLDTILPYNGRQGDSTGSRCHAEETEVVKPVQFRQTAESHRQCQADHSCWPTTGTTESHRQCQGGLSTEEVFHLQGGRQISLTIDSPAQACPHSPSAPEQCPHVPATTRVLPHISTKNQVYTHIPTSPQVYPRTSMAPRVHADTQTSPHVYSQIHKTPWVYPHAPTSPQVYPHTPTSPQMYPHAPTSPQVYPHTPTSPQMYPHAPTSPQVYPHAPTSPQVYPHTPTSPQMYPYPPNSPRVYPDSPTSSQHALPTPQSNPHKQALDFVLPTNWSATKTALDTLLVSETDGRRGIQGLPSSPPGDLNTRPPSRTVSGLSSDLCCSIPESDIWSFLSTSSDPYGAVRRKDGHLKSENCGKEGFDSKEVNSLCQILGVRFPPTNGRVESPRPSHETDFPDFLDVSLFHLSSLSSAPQSLCPQLDVDSLTTRELKNSMKTCRACSVNESANETPAGRPVFNKSFSMEPKPFRGPRHGLKLDRLQSNDLSGNYVSVSSIAPKTSSMTCINIPLN